MIYAYVSCADSNTIHVFTLDPGTGALTLVEIVNNRAVGVGLSSPLAVSPDKRFMFVGNRAEPFSVTTFGIDPQSGKLTLKSKGPLVHQMAYIATDHTGRYLLSASYHGSLVSVNPIAAGGRVGPAQQVVRTPLKAHSILPDAANRYVFVPTLGGDVVVAFRFDAATGTLSPSDPPEIPVRAGAGPRHLRFHPNGRLVYLLNETDGSLYVFDYEAATGAWREKQITTLVPAGFEAEPWGSDLQITPDGAFLYGAERRSSTLAGFRVSPEDGRLTPTGNWETETQPRGFAIDPTGRYLLAVGQLSHGLTSYAIEPDGTLRTLKRYEVGKNPNWIEFLTLPA